MLKNTTPVICAMALAMVLLSCAREVLEPGQMITGKYAPDDGSGLASEYISFDGGEISEYCSRTNEPLTFAEYKFWNCLESAFAKSGTYRYSVQSGSISSDYCSGPLEVNEERISIGGRKFTRIDSFKQECYSSIETASELTVPYSSGGSTIPLTVARPIPAGEISASVQSCWISGISVEDGELRFSFEETKEDRDADIVISYTNAENKVISIHQRPSTFIVLPSTTNTLDYTGQSLSIPYSVSGSMEGASLSVSCNATWVKNISVTSSAVECLVDENTGTDNREAIFVLSCSGARDVTYVLTQDWATTSITTSPGSLSCDHSGGEFSFNVNIRNPRSGTVITATSEVSWITNMSITDNMVSFKVTENNMIGRRTGVISVKYGSYAHVNFEVSQTSSVTSIELIPASQVVPYIAEEYAFKVEISNPRSGLSLSASSQSEWISGIRIAGNEVRFSISANPSAYPRSGVIMVHYGDGISEEFGLTQEGAPVSQISINKTNLSLQVAESEALSAEVVPSDAGLVWSSSSNGVAAVDAYGKVTAVGIGNASIIVSSEDGSISASCHVTVYGKENNLSLSTSWTVSEGLTYGTVGTITIINPTGGTLSISNSPNSSIAKASAISSNRITITPVSSGETSITIKSAATNTYAEASRSVTIKVKKAAPSFSISPTSMTLYSNGPSGAIAITSNSDCSFTAQSANTSIATVSVNGKTVTVTPKNSGSVYVTVNCPSTGRYEAAASLLCQINVYNDLSYPVSANCYVVSKSGEYRFRTVKGNSSADVGSVSSASVLWESYGTSTQPSVGSVINSVSYSNGYVTFTTPSTLKDGNAVIAVKNSSGTILWSWHIWVCSGYDPVAYGQTYFNNAGIVMDRNLGALSSAPGDVRTLGLFYQWGRKDPFLGSANIGSVAEKAKSTITWPSFVKSDSSVGTIEFAIKNPTTFISGNDLNYDWYYTGSELSENTRWTADKTIYDPCPPGWKVPKGGGGGVWANALGDGTPLQGFPVDNTNMGIDFTGNFGSASHIWYPFAGWLKNGNGTLQMVGESGYWWSVTPLEDYKAFRFYINIEGSVTPRSNRERGYGMSVRCVRE